MNILAIDPGTVRSAYIVMDPVSREVNDHGIVDNETMLEIIFMHPMMDYFVIEGVASYGKPVGKEVFQTVFWSGRFWECASQDFSYMKVIYRPDVKLHLCHATRGVNDGVLRQRLIDLFGPGKELAIGTRKKPGPLFGIRADEWQALALAVTFADQLKQEQS